MEQLSFKTSLFSKSLIKPRIRYFPLISWKCARIAIVVNMLGVLSKYMKDVSVLRKLLFTVAFLPDDLPNRWDIAVQFAYSSRGIPDISADIAKMFSENIQSLDAQAFLCDGVLQKELLKIPREKPLGSPYQFT